MASTFGYPDGYETSACPDLPNNGKDNIHHEGLRTSQPCLADTDRPCLIKVEVRYTKEMIDVGDLNLFKGTWEKIYAESGNQRSILTEDWYETNGNQCTSHAVKKDNNAKVVINGQWGKVPGLGPHDSREALVKATWEVLKDVTDPTGWNVFTNCYGTTWQEGVPNWTGSHACGGKNPTVRPDCMCDIGSAQGEFHSWGHKVPTMIKANLYRDGVLLADSLQINFGSRRNEQDEGCGTVGKIASALAGFLPGPASLFSVGVDVARGN